MGTIGTATVKIHPDTTQIVRALRILAKHASACADELETSREEDPE